MIVQISPDIGDRLFPLPPCNGIKRHKRVTETVNRLLRKPSSIFIGKTLSEFSSPGAKANERARERESERARERESERARERESERVRERESERARERESERARERESGRAGERESGRAGERESGRAGERESERARAGERESEGTRNKYVDLHEANVRSFWMFSGHNQRYQISA